MRKLRTEEFNNFPKVTQLEFEPKLSGSSLCPHVHLPEGRVELPCCVTGRWWAVCPAGVLERH